ncbi:MFS general substrate transporter [Mycena galericulata]|nr:MFS general substrate transporter [Mycena galericulata]
MSAAAEVPDSKPATLETSEPGPGSPAEEPDSEAVAPPPTFPEGGFQAWATVAGAALLQFCGIGYTSSFGVFQDFYTQDYLTHSSSSAISWIGSINALLIVSSGLITGRLHDRGYFYPLLYGGSLLLAFSLFMLSLCKPNEYYKIFLAQGIGAGIGAGAVYVPSVAVVAHYFKKRRTLAMTIVTAGSSIGATVHPIMLNNTLRSRNLGFGGAVRASAGLISGLLLIACCLMHPRLPPSQIHPPLWKALRRFSRDVPYILATIGLTTSMIGYFFPFFYLQLASIKHGIDETFSFYSLVILNASSVVGRLSPGFLNPNKFGVIEMVVVASGCGAAVIFSMIALKTVASVVIIAVMYGFCAGVFATLQSPLMAVLTEDMGELGLRIGVAYAVVGVGVLIGPPIDGALLTNRYFWWRPALFSGLMELTGFSFFVATLVAVRRRNKAKEIPAMEVHALEKYK